MIGVNAIEAALAHVRQFHPEVVQVTFDRDDECDFWIYADNLGNAPTFGSAVDIGILKDAIDAAYAVGAFPLTFRA